MANTNIKYLKENNLYEAHKHFMRLSESYVGFPEMKHGVVIEDDDDPNAAGQGPNAMGGAPGADPNAMGGMPPAGDPNAAGGMPGGDPNAMGGDPMAGGGPNAQMGADPNAMGQPMPDAADPMAGEDTGEDPFADQRDGDTGDGGEVDGDTIDIDGLTNAQEKLNSKENQVGRDLSKVDNRILDLIDTIKGFQDKLDQNNTELENLKAEFEKRNPTQTEKLDLRGAIDSYPFNVRPDDFWANKVKERDNYEVYSDNDKPVDDQYTITSDDLDDDMPSDISKSFSVADDDIQTLEKLFRL